MTDCYDEGTLRAQLDRALPAEHQQAVAQHLRDCAACRRRQDAMRAVNERVAAALDTPVDSSAALERFRRAHPVQQPQAAADQHLHNRPTRIIQRSYFMSKRSFGATRRPLFAGLAALVVAVALLALPPVRAAADQLLQVFRVQNVVFLPIDQDRLAQLRDLKVDKDALFLSKPQVDNQQPPRTVASAAEAAQAVGAPVAEIAQLPSPSTTVSYTVDTPHNVQFQVNPATLRSLLTQLNITDVSIPDALGSGPISAAIPASAQTRYVGANYDMVLHQVSSPSVTLPEGVELAQLGKAALRVLGMDAAQAEATSQQIDWNSTLIFPFPADASNIRQVTVGGAPALLMSGQNDGQAYGQLSWQQGDQIFMLRAEGSMRAETLNNALLEAAKSVQ